MHFEIKDYGTVIFRYVMGLCIFAMLATIGLYAYLGTFSRYLGDDYCETMVFKNSSLISAVLNRYEDGQWRAANRYSNLLFVGVAESLFGSQNIKIIPVVFILLWGIGSVYLVQQARKLAGIQWRISVDIFLGAALAFFS